MHCQVCGRNLGAVGWLRALLRPAGCVYPFRRVDGSRLEKRVRWICFRCESRALRLRTAGEMDQSLAEEVDRRKLLGR